MWPPGLPHLWQANVLANSRWDKGALLEAASCLWLPHLELSACLPACREQSSDQVQVVYKRKNQVGRLVQASCALARLTDKLALLQIVQCPSNLMCSLGPPKAFDVVTCSLMCGLA